MDRRRMLLIGFLVLTLIAIGDVYINGFGMFEQFAQGFSFSMESQHAKIETTLEVAQDAASVDRLLMQGKGQVINVRGAATDEVKITATVLVFAQKDEDAQAYVNAGLRIDPVIEDGMLIPRLVEGPRKGIERTMVYWVVTVPDDLAVEISNSLGAVDVQDVDAPVKVTSSGTVSIANAGAPLRLISQGGVLEVRNVRGDAFIENSLGSLDVEGVVGNLDLRSSTSDAKVRNVRGQVTAQGSWGTMEFVQVYGGLDVRQTMGALNARDIGGPITVSVDTGAAVIQPSEANKITATVTTGDLGLLIPRHLVAQYEFALLVNPGELRPDPEIAELMKQAEGKPDRHPVQATVRNGDLKVRLAE